MSGWKLQFQPEPEGYVFASWWRRQVAVILSQDLRGVKSKLSYSLSDSVETIGSADISAACRYFGSGSGLKEHDGAAFPEKTAVTGLASSMQAKGGALGLVDLLRTPLARTGG